MLMLAGAAIAAIIGLIQLSRMLWKAFRTIDAIHGLVEHQLRPNGGESLFDKVTRLDQWRGDHEEITQSDRSRIDETARLAEETAEMVRFTDERIDAIARHLGITIVDAPAVEPAAGDDGED